MMEATERKKMGAFEKRIHEIDFIRGLLMCLVIMDHVFWFIKQYSGIIYDANSVPFFKVMFDIFNFYWTSNIRVIVRQLVLFGFVFISGISCAFSKNNWKRAAQMVLVWGVICVTTNIIHAVAKYALNGGEIPSISLVLDFNVIGVLAFSILIYCFFQNRSWKALAAFGLICLLFQIIVIPTLMNIPGIVQYPLPVLWRFDFTPEYLATSNNVYFYGDWLPLFPYICYFFMGAIVAKFIYKDRVSLFQNRKEFERPFCFIGRHAIWVYLLHEPILMAIAAFIMIFVK